MNRSTICLGANAPDAEIRLREAVDFLVTLGGIVRRSSTYRTAPEYAGPAEPYLNEVIEFITKYDYDELRLLVKAYEASVRAQLPEAWEGLVILDIDIVLWNGAAVRPVDAASRYFQTGLAKLR